MNAALFGRGVAVAILLSLAGAVLFAVFAPLLGGALALRGVLLLVAAGCLVDLLLRASGQAGRLLASSGALLIAAALIVVDPPLWTWWLLPAGYLWLLRSLSPGARPLRALVDAVLTVVGIASALACLRHTGSVGLALWCWLLLQALATGLSSAAGRTAPTDDRFERARRDAEAALRHLQQPHPSN